MNLNILKKKCDENGITFSALEKTLDIGNGVIAKWKSGSPRVETIKKVADFFDCTIEELLEDE